MLIAFVGSVLSLVFGDFAISLVSPTSQATIVASVITILGIIFSATHGEISSYYKDKREQREKVNLVPPYATKYYKSWINVATGLQTVLKHFDPQKKPRHDLLHIVYLITFFYGYRLQLVMEAGSLILLSTKSR